MALQLLPPPEDRPNAAEPGTGGPRILARGAPISPGVAPSELAEHLVFGEALVWWGDKDRIHYGPILMVLGAITAILAFVTLLAPEFWLSPPMELARPLLALLSPAIFLLVRERLNQRAVMVTDGCVVEVDANGSATRIRLDKIQAVRRDLLRGGVALYSGGTKLLIPPPLTEDARAAIASQLKSRVRAGEVDDRLGWLP